MIDVETARGYYTDGDSAHGFDHVLRVWRMALHLAEEEGADRDIVSAAALLHDVGRAEERRTGVCHAQEGARRAREILSGQPTAFVEAVAEAIAQHRFRAGQQPTTLEARILFDADKLDAIGAIGVARAYAVAGMLHQHLWARVDPAYAERPPQAGANDMGESEHTPVHEYLFKLVKLQDRLTTRTGQRIAQGRHRFMVAFFERLEAEVAGQL
ncbi:MAG: HD domain-containing protein [Chloroflexi bacterium]|jgi:uncharacterized protein|nr:HD domain-containing protein [Chloroflexota bacterium]